jgi:LmbE family N-acetylglucosaminyl deacetylase
MTVLVVAAHPDDEVLGAGATIAQHAAAGEAVHIVIMAEGITARSDGRDPADVAALERLHATARQVGAGLGAKSVELLGLPDNRLDSMPLLDVIKRVETAIAAVAPDVVYTHHPGDLNVDHRITFQAVLTALRPMRGRKVRELLSFEVPSSTEWAFQRIEPVFRPSVFRDVGATLAKKVQAMALYEGEARPFPHPRSGEALEHIARRWGSVVGFDAAEAFELIWSLRK